MSTSANNQIKEFVEIFNEIRSTIVQELHHVYTMPEDAIEYIIQMLDYTCKGGKYARGLTVVQGTEILIKTLQNNNGEFTNEMKKKASILGWCIEFAQAFFLVADDIMDNSVTRRGAPCWYRLPHVQLTGINDSFLLEAMVYRILYHYFRNDSYYTNLLQLFHSIIYRTELGQLLDISFEKEKHNIQLSKFTEEKYYKIVTNKTAYYTYYLPVACALTLAGVEQEKNYKEAESICLLIGQYFQIQDDYLDCYGDPTVIGKIGTDIQDAKCSWLMVQAKKRATPEQLTVLGKNYGQNDQEKIDTVKKVYAELRLEDIYTKFEAEIYEKIQDEIKKISVDLPAEMFKMLVDKIYRRKK